MIWNPRAEAQSPGDRAALQLARLKETLAWAIGRVPFYWERLGAARVERLDDLARLPFTRKSDLREHYPFGLFAVPREEIVRIHASSGTKGKPTVVAYTAGDMEVWREVMARTIVAAGGRRGDLLQNAFGYGLFTGGLGFHQAAELIGMTVVPASSGNTARQCLLLRDFKPAALCATPSFALHIAETLAEQGSKPEQLGLRYGMFGAEPWTDDMLIIKGVNVYPSEVEGALLGVADLVPQYLLVVDRTATLARVEVQVEPAPAFLERCGSIEPDHPEVGKLRGEVAARLRAA